MSSSGQTKTTTLTFSTSCPGVEECHPTTGKGVEVLPDRRLPTSPRRFDGTNHDVYWEGFRESPLPPHVFCNRPFTSFSQKVLGQTSVLTILSVPFICQERLRVTPKK